MPGTLIPRLTCASLFLLAAPFSIPQSSPAAPTNAVIQFPSQETLVYGVEWRLIYAGSVRMNLAPIKDKPEWEAKLHIESAGLVSKLYKLDDTYDVRISDQFCTNGYSLDSTERNRHHDTKVTYDYTRGKASYLERDLIKNSVFKTAETDIPGCVSDIIGALHKLRGLRLDVGQSVQVPLSDGKKFVSARVEAQAREQLKTKAGTFNTIRCEAFVFNGILYSRKGELFVWFSDDARRIPVRIRARLNFPVGSITVELEKEEHS
jgi:hypothetical protein